MSTLSTFSHSERERVVSHVLCLPMKHCVTGRVLCQWPTFHKKQMLQEEAAKGVSPHTRVVTAKGNERIMWA